MELHDFHIHQLHFQLRDWSGFAVNEPFLRDTVNVPYYNGHMLNYPSVRLRMDFRDPNIVGTFVYHCHHARARGRRHDGHDPRRAGGQNGFYPASSKLTNKGESYDER